MKVYPYLLLTLAMSLAACLPDRTEPLPGLTAAVKVSDLPALTAALAGASVQPNTTIKIMADITFSETLVVRGKGTILDLNHRALTYTGHNDGTNGGGCGVYVMPLVSEPVPITLPPTGILCNVRGYVGVLEKQLGGNCPEGTFNEMVPLQYADEKRHDTYTLQRSILTPAENITIKNGRFVCGNPQAYGLLNIVMARQVTVSNVVFDWSAGADANANIGIWSGQHVRFNNCDFGGRYCGPGAGAYDVAIKNCKNGAVNIEERSCKIVVDNCDLLHVRTNDVTCDDIAVKNCRLSEPDANFGCLALPEIGNATITGNTLTGCGGAWIGTIANTGTATISGNTGRGLVVFGDADTVARVKQSGNQWRGN